MGLPESGFSGCLQSLQGNVGADLSITTKQPPSESLVVHLSLLFDLEDGDKMFLENFGLSPNYTALEPT
jgi:hypothetical protein